VTPVTRKVAKASIALSLFNSVSCGSLSLSLLPLASMASLNHIWRRRAVTQDEPWPRHGDGDDLALHHDDHDGRRCGALASTRHGGGSSRAPRPQPPPHRPRREVGWREEQWRHDGRWHTWWHEFPGRSASARSWADGDALITHHPRGCETG
jgi:hypothetical protein